MAIPSKYSSEIAPFIYSWSQVFSSGGAYAGDSIAGISGYATSPTDLYISNANIISGNMAVSLTLSSGGIGGKTELYQVWHKIHTTNGNTLEYQGEVNLIVGIST